MNNPPKPRGTAPLQLPEDFDKPASDKMRVTGAQEVIRGTGRLKLPPVNLDDIEIPGL